MADVLWVLLCLANQTGINLTEAFEKNLLKKTNRDKERHINNPKLIRIMDKYNEALQNYNTNLNDDVVKQEVEQILRENLSKYSNTDVYKFLFGCIH